jgi:uncharacterized protein YndB with AHSA1/START domain
MTQQATETSPIRKTITVTRPVEDAFRVFTEGIVSWWPLASHAISDDAEAAVFEPREGGRVYERARSGEEVVWGTVRVWEPPERVVFTWSMPHWSVDALTEVDVRFAPHEGGTKVVLEHRGWERLGDDGPKRRASYDGGWDYIFGERFTSAANAR